MRRYICRHCGGHVPHDAPTDLCGSCACLPVAERGRPREPDDDVRQPTKCRHCTRGGQGAVCDSCRELVAGLELDITNGFPAPAPARKAEETEDERRDRFHSERVASVNASFMRGRRCLLARALGGFPGGLERAQPKL